MPHKHLIASNSRTQPFERGGVYVDKSCFFIHADKFLFICRAKVRNCTQQG